MSDDNESKEHALTLLDLKHLEDARATAEAKLSEYQSNLDSEQAMLDGLLAEPETTNNEQYLMLAKKACRSGIYAWVCDIEDLKHEIDMYTAKINTRLARIATGEMQ